MQSLKLQLKTKNFPISKFFFHFPFFIFHSKFKQGYIALTTVILLSAVIILITTETSLLAIGQAQSSYALFNGENTLTFVEGCMEDALLKSQASATYSGGTITRPEGTCTIIITKNVNIWTITATTPNINYHRTIQAIITRSTSLTLTSWKEL